jgi:asparagine synthase (glutamine-hydrolysing)
MCGVVFSLFSNEEEKEMIIKNVNKIKHRGPENTTIIETNSYVLGFHRLKIIGNSDIGNQPFVNDNWTFACNGEIYNYKELMIGHNIDSLKSDVEIIPKLLNNNKMDVFSLINKFKLFDGDFACVHLYKDSKNNMNIIVARDRVGLCPLFYGLDKNNKIVCFASEAKALMNLPFCVKIKQFPPGHFLMSSMNTEMNENNGFGFKEEFVLYNNEAEIENISNIVRILVENAVSKRLKHSDRQVGVLCSGGIDSSIVSAIATRLNTNELPINIFTISYDSGMSYDAFYAKQLCSQLKNCIHTNITFNKDDVINAYEQVLKTCETADSRTIRAAIPGYLLAKYISENTDIKVILSGEGADELFAGYKYFQFSPSEEELKTETTRLIKNLHSFDLLRAERVFSAFGLELRVPFLDQNLIKSISCFSEYIYEYKTEEKYLLRKAFDSYPELSNVINRQKECFSDGCGYNYVPDLLRYHSTYSDLESKEKDEKKVYLKLFEQYYGNHNWIIERTMPEWIPKIDSQNMIGVNGI